MGDSTVITRKLWNRKTTLKQYILHLCSSGYFCRTIVANTYSITIYSRRIYPGLLVTEITMAAKALSQPGLTLRV